MSAIDSLRTLADHCNGIPVPDTPVDRLAEIEIDPAEFQKARELRHALKEVAGYVNSILTEPRLIDKFSGLPSALQVKIEVLANTIDQVVQSLSAFTKPSLPPGAAGALPPRWSPQQFQEAATKVEAMDGELYQLVEPNREFSPSDVQGEIERLKQSVLEATLERQSTKDTTKEAKETTDQLDRKTKKSAALVLSDVATKELDEAIGLYTGSAKYWLIFLAASAIIAFRLAWWVNIPDDKILWIWGPVFPQPVLPLETLDVTVNLGRKILLLSAAFAVPMLALRVYYTNLHNVVINRQRKISVNAFTKLYALMENSDPATKTELVKQAAQTIFAQGTTGFLSKKGDIPVTQLVSGLLRSAKN